MATPDSNNTDVPVTGSRAMIGGGISSPSSAAVVIDQSVSSSSQSLPPPPAEESAVESGNGLNGNAGKKAPVWNKPSNVALAEVVPVMGGESWPLLSESVRISTKPSTDSLKGLPDSSEATGTASSPSPRQTSTNAANHNATPNHTIPVRQKSMRRNAASTSSNNGLPEVPEPLGTVVDMPPNNPSPRDNTQRSGSAPQSQNANGQPQQRNSFRSRNGNSHPRGDSSHHHNHGGRRDQDRGNQDWNAHRQDWNAHRQDWNPHRSFNGRDAHMQSQRGVPRFNRPPPPPPPPPGSAPYIPHSPVNPFVPPVAYHELPTPLYYFTPPESLRGVPLAGPLLPHHLLYPPPPPDPYFHDRIMNQIDYYFSNENLIRDTYLRQNMDEQGWVPISLIAGFNKVRQLTDNIPLILDVVRSSAVVEVQGDKVRKRNDWKRWLMPPSVQFANAPNAHDMLTAQLQATALEERTGSSSSTRVQADAYSEGFLSRSSSEDLYNHSQLSSCEEGTSDHSTSARNSSKRDEC